MKRKINTFKGDAKDGLSPTNYIEPEKLTGKETSILQVHAAKGLEKTAYRNTKKRYLSLRVFNNCCKTVF
jgi:hypothetical protein